MSSSQGLRRYLLTQYHIPGKIISQYVYFQLSGILLLCCTSLLALWTSESEYLLANFGSSDIQESLQFYWVMLFLENHEWAVLLLLPFLGHWIPSITGFVHCCYMGPWLKWPVHRQYLFSPYLSLKTCILFRSNSMPNKCLYLFTALQPNVAMWINSAQLRYKWKLLNWTLKKGIFFLLCFFFNLLLAFKNCQYPLDHQKSKRVPEKHLFMLYWLCQRLWLCGSQ